jgi:flagellar biogenesis protein FliO
LTATGLDNNSLILRMLLAVGAVVGLGVVALYLSKKVLPRVTNSAGREIRIVETTCLGPRKALHLVKVGDQRLLIASAGDSVTMLAHLDDVPAETLEQLSDNGSKP